MNMELVREFEKQIPLRLQAGNCCLKCGRLNTEDEEADGLHYYECYLRTPDAEEFGFALSGNPACYGIMLEEAIKAGMLDPKGFILDPVHREVSQ
jgi:hypothetical protein